MKQDERVKNKYPSMEPLEYFNGGGLYEPRKSGKFFYKLATSNSKNAKMYDLQETQEQIEEKIKQNKDYRVITSHIDNSDLDIKLFNFHLLDNNTNKLAFMLLKEADKQGLTKTNNILTFKLSDYMQARGLTNTKKASESLKRELDNLIALTIDYNNKTIKGNDGVLGIARSYKRSGGYIEVLMDGFLIEEQIQNNKTVIDFPRTLEQLNTQKYPNSYAVAQYILNMINQSSSKRERVLNVKTLLKNAFTLLPSEENVKRNKGVKQNRIMNPFIDTLNYLQDDMKYFMWEWELNNDLSQEEKDNVKNLIEVNYSLFKEAKIRFTVYDNYPNQTKKIEHKKQHIEKNKTRKEKLEKETTKQKAKLIAKKEIEQEGKN